jgi:ADP-heptose:LPS heptosyltransferase
MAVGARRTFAAALPQYAERKRGYAARLLELGGRVHQAKVVEAWGRLLGCPVTCSVPRFEVDESCRAAAAQALRTLGIEEKGRRGRPAVAINLGNQKKAGRDTYSAENGRRLVQGLADAFRVVILQGAHPLEAEAARALAEWGGHGVLLAPRLPLGSLAGFVAEMDVLVSPCTGVLHLAQAVRTPAVALCRQFNYDVWRPLEPPHRSLVGVPGDAVDEIAPERVVGEVMALLRNARHFEGERKDGSAADAGGSDSG